MYLFCGIRPVYILYEKSNQSFSLFSRIITDVFVLPCFSKCNLRLIRNFILSQFCEFVNANSKKIYIHYLFLQVTITKHCTTVRFMFIRFYHTLPYYTLYLLIRQTFAKLNYLSLKLLQSIASYRGLVDKES